MSDTYGKAHIPDNSLLTETMRSFVDAAGCGFGLTQVQMAPRLNTAAEAAMLHNAASKRIRAAISRIDRDVIASTIPAGMPCTCRSRPQRVESSNFPGWRRCCGCKGFRSPRPLLGKH